MKFLLYQIRSTAEFPSGDRMALHGMHAETKIPADARAINIALSDRQA
jgi:hypothetical protein